MESGCFLTYMSIKSFLTFESSITMSTCTELITRYLLFLGVLTYDEQNQLS
ncbi:unnamed protein product [Callosobruchus maculatus]|uniref:Uncharacterized protein n=1 Tax=Callosobruchus maculatus TaxID=64391 RepID=A0A653CYP3_CALMS|nr:unnamed protein product [Callosobruchus maculatus]